MQELTANVRRKQSALVTNVFFVVFASGEEQPWNRRSTFNPQRRLPEREISETEANFDDETGLLLSE